MLSGSGNYSTRPVNMGKPADIGLLVWPAWNYSELPHLAGCLEADQIGPPRKFAELADQ